MAKKKSKSKKRRINEKDKKFIATLISVLVILGVIVLVIYSSNKPYKPMVPDNATVCPEGSKSVDVCTQQYDPVCGYDIYGKEVDTFSNNCFACKNASIESFIEGECSK